MVPDRGISSSLTRSVVLCFVYLLRELLGLYAKYQGKDMTLTGQTLDCDSVGQENLRKDPERNGLLYWEMHMHGLHVSVHIFAFFPRCGVLFPRLWKCLRPMGYSTVVGAFGFSAGFLFFRPVARIEMVHPPPVAVGDYLRGQATNCDCNCDEFSTSVVERNIYRV